MCHSRLCAGLLCVDRTVWSLSCISGCACADPPGHQMSSKTVMGLVQHKHVCGLSCRHAGLFTSRAAHMKSSIRIFGGVVQFSFRSFCPLVCPRSCYLVFAQIIPSLNVHVSLGSVASFHLECAVAVCDGDLSLDRLILGCKD